MQNKMSIGFLLANLKIFTEVYIIMVSCAVFVKWARRRGFKYDGWGHYRRWVISNINGQRLGQRFTFHQIRRNEWCVLTESRNDEMIGGGECWCRWPSPSIFPLSSLTLCEEYDTMLGLKKFGAEVPVAACKFT
jgi:hypothetical protein